MSKTANREELLQACVQDLHAARGVAAAGLPRIAEHAGEALAAQLDTLAQTYADEAEQLAATGISLEGPGNLWMAGVMDDAERDTESIEPGALLDTALIGAIRKGVAADGVSLETAVAVAQALGNGEVAALAQSLRERSRAADEALRVLLERTA